MKILSKYLFSFPSQKHFLFFAFFFFQITFLFGQKKSGDAKQKAQMILNFTTYIHWDGQEKFQSFNIGVLGDEPEIFAELDKTADVRAINGKMVFVKQFKTIEEIKGVQMLYVNERSGFVMKTILQKIKGTGTLVISENYPYQSSMVNFIQSGNFLKFEYNKERILAEKMQISSGLDEFAIMSDKDWREFAEQRSKELKTKSAELEMQQEKVEVQEIILKKKESEIDKKNMQIEQQTKEIKEREKDISRQKTELESLVKESEKQRKTLDERSEILKTQQEDMMKQNNEIEKQKKILTKQKIETKKLAQQIEEQKNTLSEKESEIEKQRQVIYFAVVIVLLIAGFGFYIFRQYKAKQRINKMLEEKNIAIQEQKEQIEHQKKLVDDKNKNITASINYAKRIQQAILISREQLEKIMPEHFIFYRPRDIVSGDFFWAHKKENGKLIFAAVDCTGHGVPGAFMSMVGNALLNEIVVENGIEEPHEILNHLKTGIIRALKQTGSAGEQKDGMDIALCTTDLKSVLHFSGAYNPLYHFRNGIFTEYKGDKQTLGFQKGKENSFTKHTIRIQKNDTVYVFTDGFADQKGGKDGRKFYYKPLQELFASVQHLPMLEQRSVVKRTFEEWKGNYEQIDDICIMGIRI